MSVQVTVLENGMRIVSDTIPSVETVSVGVWVKAGARDEGVENNGVAHFLEHMAFKGTRTRSAQDIAEAIENVGGYLNAYTSREMTAYYARVLKADTRLAVELLGDILQNSTFDPTEMQKEREVILQEIGQSHDTPDDIVFDYYQETSFPNQSMGRAILGPAENVSGMQRETLMQFMNQHYTPNQMVLAAAGAVSHDDLVALGRDIFGALKNRAAPEKNVPSYVGGDFREERALEQLHVVLGFQGPALLHPDSYATALVSVVLGGGMSSRLFQEVREKRGLVYSVYAFANAFSDAGTFGIYAGSAEKDSKELVDVILGEVSRAVTTLTSQEIERGRAQLKASTLMALESTGGRAKKAAQNLLIHDRIIAQREIIEKIDWVTKEDMVRVLEEMLRSPLTFTSVGPGRGLPAFGAMQSIVKS